jgi:hypothetical protein
MGSICPSRSSIAFSIPSRIAASILQTVLQNLANDAELDGSELADLDENLERGKNDCYVPRNLLLRAAAVDRLNVAAVSEVCRDLLQPLPS